MLRTFIRDRIAELLRPVRQPLQQLLDLAIYQQAHDVALRHPNPLNRFGRKIFSQADEDGITMEILRRINVAEGVFAEFGVGNGLENNTLTLVALGWKGFWVGGESLVITLTTEDTGFCYVKRWITCDNVAELAAEGLRAIEETAIDVLALDLDGNDIFLVERLLQAAHRPKLFIVEYNAKFPPPLRWHTEYDAEHQWQGDDYFGASLTSYDDLFRKHNYFLVCCNSQTGSNAFYVDEQFADRFSDVPRKLSDLYADPRYYLYQQYGHVASVKTVDVMFRRRSHVRSLNTAGNSVTSTLAPLPTDPESTRQP